VDLAGSGQRPISCFCQHVNEGPGTTNGGDFLGELSHYQFLMKDFCVQLFTSSFFSFQGSCVNQAWYKS
jgi:hypothetical protein